MKYKFDRDEQGHIIHCDKNIYHMNWFIYMVNYIEVDFNMLIESVKDILYGTCRLCQMLIVLLTFPISVPIISIIGLHSEKKRIKRFWSHKPNELL